MRIVHDPWVGESVVSSVKPLIEKWARIIPPWVNFITITSDPDVNTTAEIRVHFEYRTATIAIGNRWSEVLSVSHESVIVHELCHLYTVPLSQKSKEVLNAFFRDQEDPHYKLAWDSVTQTMEGITEDLAQTFQRVIEFDGDQLKRP